MRRGTRCAPAALRSNSHGEPVNEARMRAPAPMPPRKCSPPGASRRGGAAQQPEHPHGPSLRSAPHVRGASALRCACRAERSDGPYGCLIRNPLLCAPRSADQAVAGVPQDTPASFAGSPRLSERSAQRAVSSAVHRLVEHRRLPRRPGAGVAHSRVAFSLVTFSLAKQEKVTAPPGAHPGPRPQHKHAAYTLHAARCTLHTNAPK